MEGHSFFLVLYINDILLVSNDGDLFYESKNFLSKAFDMKDLGKASFVLGIEIHCDKDCRLLRLSQKAYIERML